MKHPPEHCTRKKFDGIDFWVEPSICAYRCDKKLTCKLWEVFEIGTKQRKKFATGIEEAVETPKPVEAIVTPAPTKINRRRR